MTLGASLHDGKSVQHLRRGACPSMLCPTPGMPPLFSHSAEPLHDPADCSTPGLCVLHCLPQSAQIHVHWVYSAIQPSPTLCRPLLLLPSASGSFPVSRLFTSGGQSIGVSSSVLPMNIQAWFPLGLTGLISLLSKGLFSLLKPCSKASVLWCSAFFMVQLSHWYVTIGKTVTCTPSIKSGKDVAQDSFANAW